MVEESDWTLVSEPSAGFEADLAVSLLEAAKIPVIQKGPETGIFGPGFAGSSPLGIRLYVPTSMLEEARDILHADSDASS
jgi:hypothetical protein